MPVSDADQLAQPGDELGGGMVLIQILQRKSIGEHAARQPAGVGAPVIPDVFEDVGHLQPLAKTNRQLHQLFPMTRHGRRVQTEQLRQHLAHHACHVIAVTTQCLDVRQAVQALVALELRHAAAHDAHAARQGGLLRRAETVSHANYPRGVFHQFAFRRQHLPGKHTGQVPGEGRGRLVALDHRNETMMKLRLLSLGRPHVVFNGVSQPAQQVGVGHDPIQLKRKLGDGQGKGPGHPRQNLSLVSQIISRIVGELLLHGLAAGTRGRFPMLCLPVMVTRAPRTPPGSALDLQ